MQSNRIVEFNYLQDRGKKHCTKEEIANRKSTQIQIGEPIYKKPASIRGNKVATKKWNEITGYYKKANLSITSSSDTATIARYCLLHAEYEEIIANPIENPAKNKTYEPGHMGDWVRYQNAKQKISNDLLKLENCLFLTPLSKFKNIPMLIKKEKKDDLSKLGFEL